MAPDRGHFELPPRLSESLALTAALRRFPALFMPTFRAAVERFGAFPSLGGWIDMKIDPISGAERGAGAQRAPSTERQGEADLYARGRVYGWIQGRGLEAMSAFIRWKESSPEARSPETGPIDAARAAKSLYARIVETCFPERDGRLRGGFVMDPEGNNLGDQVKASGTTLTALFLLRGLIAYASLGRRGEDWSWIVTALRGAIDAALRGECLNDQLSFGASGGGAAQGISPDARLRGYEGRMIALGACRLLYGHTLDPADSDRGARLVESVLKEHFFRNEEGEAWLSDLPTGWPVQGRESALDPKRAPGLGSLCPVNPGHIIEFAGLALQFHRLAGCLAPERLAILGELATTSWSLGRAPFGGIVRGMDGLGGGILDPHCPWWSSFEAVRSFSELLLSTEDAETRVRCVDIIGLSLDCIESAYLGPSKTGIPVQTLSPEGQVADFIPATPDLDPGYHTGIPLIDADIALRDFRAMLAGAAEASLPPRLGALLQGHIARNLPADSELDSLRVRACVMEARGSSAAFLSADVLEFSTEWAEGLCRELSAASGIDAERIFLTATHTHTAPAAIRLGTRREDAAFLDDLRAAMIGALRAALERKKPVVGLMGSVEIEELGINRRRYDPDTGRVSMRPNPTGERDREIGCLYLIDGQGKPAAILLNLAVHPTALGVGIHAISADYPGRAAAALKRQYGEELVVLPIQGACGDVRPALLDPEGESFVDGTPADIERIGREIADKIVQAAQAGAGRPGGGFAWLDVLRLTSVSKLVDLPYFSIKSRDEVEGFRAGMLSLKAESVQAKSAKGFAATHDNPALGAESLAAWAERMLDTAFASSGRYMGPSSESARFGFCELVGRDGRTLQFFSLPGEAFSRIGLALKTAAAPSMLFVCGYCGGTVGYIPTAESFSQGGYEVDQAYMYYGRPAALSPSVESMIPTLYGELREEAR